MIAVLEEETEALQQGGSEHLAAVLDTRMIQAQHENRERLREYFDSAP